MLKKVELPAGLNEDGRQLALKVRRQIMDIDKTLDAVLPSSAGIQVVRMNLDHACFFALQEIAKVKKFQEGKSRGNRQN